MHGNLTPSHLFVTRGPDGLPVVKVLGFGVADLALFVAAR